MPNYVVLVLGNKGGGLHHLQGHHTQGPWIDLTLEIHQLSNWGLNFIFILYTYFSQMLV